MACRNGHRGCLTDVNSGVVSEPVDAHVDVAGLNNSVDPVANPPVVQLPVGAAAASSSPPAVSQDHLNIFWFSTVSERLNSRLIFMRAALLLLLATASTQVGGPWKWDPAADRINRFEGLISVESANPEFELLSFTGGVETYGPATKLKVAFYLPHSSPVVLLAQELQEDKYYRMEAKPATWKAAAWNTFEPWDTSVVIDAKQVARDNIGVVVHLSQDVLASGTIAPAFVYHTATTRRATMYAFVFRTRSTMARVMYSVTSAGAAPAQPQILEGDFIRHVPVTLNIDATKLTPGQNVLSITCIPTSLREAKIERQYTFEHRR